jgi:hypothetical protein
MKTTHSLLHGLVYSLPASMLQIQATLDRLDLGLCGELSIAVFLNLGQFQLAVSTL